MARPTDYTPELASLICGRIAEGESLRAVCRDPEMPASSTIFLWLSQHSEFSEQYAKAMEARADGMFDELLEIADDGTNDYIANPDGDDRYNSEHVQRSKLRVDTRKWVLARMSPRKYGDKQEVALTGKDGGPVEHSLTITFTDDHD